MAKITLLPAQYIIDGFKGVLDFYTWKGIHCVRRWPRFPPRKRSAAELAAVEDFAYANHQATEVDEGIHTLYTEMASGTRHTWKDWFVRAYISGIDYKVAP